MSKKIIIGIAALAILGGGGYIFTESINSQVETITSEKLDSYGIKHSSVDYNMFSQTLKIHDIEATYKEQDKDANISSSIKEITIKGISKDVINNNSFDSTLICDQLSLTDYKIIFSLYGNEELVSTIGHFNVDSPKLNIKELINLHKTDRFSEKYFQTILDFKHNGINYKDINFDIKKGSEDIAQLAIADFIVAPSESNKTNIDYNNIAFTADTAKLTIEKFNIKDMALPTAKHLAKLTQLAMQLNEIEISEANQDSTQALVEYEYLSKELLLELTKITNIPFASTSIENVNLTLSELSSVVTKPISLDKFTINIEETDKNVTLDSSYGNITIPHEYFTILPINAVNTLVADKFKNGFILHGTNKKVYDKETKILNDESTLSANELATIGVKSIAKLLEKDYAFILTGDTFNSFLLNTNEDLPNAIKLSEVEFSYLDEGLIDFSYLIAEKTLGMKKEDLKQLLINELEHFKTYSIIEEENEENIKTQETKDIELVVEKLLDFLINDKKEFITNIKFNKPYTFAELLSIDYPEMTLDISTK